MTGILTAKLGPLDIAELKDYGFIPSMRCWQNGRDITDELPVFERWAFALAKRTPPPRARH